MLQQLPVCILQKCFIVLCGFYLYILSDKHHVLFILYEEEVAAEENQPDFSEMVEP